MKITVKWEVADGYAGASRPQRTIVDTDDCDWDEMNEQERKEWIAESVQYDFEQKISFEITNYGI